MGINIVGLSIINLFNHNTTNNTNLLIDIFAGIMVPIILIFTFKYSKTMSIEDYRSNVTKVKSNFNSNLNVYPNNDIVFLIVFSESLACLLLIYVLFVKPYL